MINFFAQLPGWLLAHPWWSALMFIAWLALLSLGGLALNPNGKQLRNIRRQK